MAAPNTKSKRGPTVLVTDARDAAWKSSRGSPKGASQRPQMGERAGTGIISVDRILQYASDIPSAQRRGPPEARPKVHNRTPSGRHPLDPKLSGRLLPQQIPTRTSKVSEKLVILPETDELEEEKHGFETDGQDAPPTDQELERRKVAGADDKSEAERMPKSKRTEMLSRVTAYCTAQAFKLQATANFAKKHHNARTKLYDDCLYCVYHLPLLGGTDGYRIRSSPTLKNPGGKSVLDEEIERNERREYHEGYFGETESYGIRGNHEDIESTRDESARSYSPSPNESPKRSISPPRIGPSALSFAEMFVYSYGVVVFWNFTERQEKDILADLTFSQNETGISLVSRPQEADSFETEEFHFEYNPHIARPRIFNDMITLRSGDHMVKLAMSHALAQSTKLSFFEEGMERTMHEAQYVPRRLALTGRLGMNRAEVVKILGRLFQSRVDVNLSSNVLDVPNFFWDSEPTLHPLYSAVREYLEIKPRIQVLNERCRVFLDLAEILSDSIADTKMTKITWIIIVLIVLSIFVTVSEVFLRFAILNGEKAKNPGEGVKAMMEVVRPTFAGLPVKTTRSFARMGLIASWGLIAVSCFDQLGGGT